MKTYCYTVKLNIVAPLLSQASGGRAYGLDTAALFHDDKLVLPGSLIRGNVRHAWTFFKDTLQAAEQLKADTLPLESWLGKESDDEDNTPQRARLHFAYYWQAEADKAAQNNAVRHRIQIESDTGKVKKGALQVIETPFASGDIIIFSGDIHAILQNDSEAEQLKHWLYKALRYIPALGAFKGVGFGCIEGVDIHCEKKAVRTADFSAIDTGFGIIIKPQAPFCIARHHIKNNRFETESFIPGGAIKGILAEQVGKQGWNRAAYPALAKHFDQVRITHAYPAPVEQLKRPMAIPFSLVSADKLYDVALLDKPGLIDKRAPAFCVDWKDEWQDAEALCGFGMAPNRHIQVRTKIKENSGNLVSSADESHLFATETLSPARHHWLANVECSKVPEAERPGVINELGQLFSQGLFNLGKTKAYTEVEPLSRPHEHALSSIKDSMFINQTVVVTLQSAARLLLPPYEIPATNGGEALKAAYEKVWAALSENSLTLSHFYARQQLVGGNYLYRRFWHDKPYNPELLTEAGSVFVFTVKEADESTAEEKLRAWLRHGLPQPDGNNDWHTNPYLAEHGYGEIAVNLELHRDKNPATQGVWQYV